MNIPDIVVMRPNEKTHSGLLNLVDFIYKNDSKQLVMIEVGSYQGESKEKIIQQSH